MGVKYSGAAAPSIQRVSPQCGITYSKEAARAPNIVAVIDIGASSLRMQIAQVNEQGEIEKLESLSQAVSIGKTSFIKGYIDRQTIEDCVRVLFVISSLLSGTFCAFIFPLV